MACQQPLWNIREIMTSACHLLLYLLAVCVSQMDVFERHEVSTVESVPFPDQSTVTNYVIQGLESTVEDFSRKHYTENFVQAALTVCRMTKAVIVGGMGNEISKEVLLKIIRVAAGNGIEKIYTGGDGVISRAAMSYLTMKYGIWGFLVHNSCHNLTLNPKRNLTIDLRAPDGRPARPDLVEELLEATQTVCEYKTVTTIQGLGLSRNANMLYRVGQTDLVIAVIDAVSEYTKIIEGMFSFDRINHLLNGTSYFRPFRILIDCNNGAAGPYAKRIFENELGAGKGSVVNYKPGEVGILDKSRVGKMNIDVEMRGSVADLGACLDGDGSRCIVYGRRGFPVPLGETAAVVASHYHAIPFFLKHKLNGIGRAYNSPSSVDNVAEKTNLKVIEVPNNWVYFIEVINSKKALLCEDDNFGIASRHVAARDGIWTILAWLSLVIHFHKPVRDILTDHWLLYGRNFVTTYEFHDIPVPAVSKVFAEMSNFTFKVDDLTTVKRTVGKDSFRIVEASTFSYPVASKKEQSTEPPLIVLVEPKGRIVYRQLIYGDRGCLQIIVEVNKTDAPFLSNKLSITESLYQLGMTLAKVTSITGKTVPDLAY